MNNKIWNHAVSEIIDEREHKTSVNKEFDLLYETFIKSIFYEIDAHLIIDDDSKSRIKKHRNLKPYWNKQTIRQSMEKCNTGRKKFRKFNGHRNIKGKLKTLFLNNRSNFDKLLRKSDRNYNNEAVLKI